MTTKPTKRKENRKEKEEKSFKTNQIETKQIEPFNKLCLYIFQYNRQIDDKQTDTA